MKTEQAEFGSRVREALRRAGLGEESKELADLVSAKGGDAVTPQAAHHWIRGKTIPRRRNLRALAELLDVSPEWLLGERPRLGRQRIGEARKGPLIGARDQQAIDAYLALPAPQRKLVRELVAVLAAAEAKR